jgi:hypothetical protein
MLVLSAMGGTTGWHYSITRHARYAPHMSNYAAGAALTHPVFRLGSRTFLDGSASMISSADGP